MATFQSGNQTDVTLNTGDIEIGAVELKNATTDDRALISDANTARAATDHVVVVQHVDSSGEVLSQATQASISTDTSLIKNNINAMRLLLDATYLKEDAVHVSGDNGIQALTVRNDTLAALAGTDGDYAPLQVSAAGALYAGISEVSGAAISATNPVFAELTDGTTAIGASNPLTVELSDGTDVALLSAASTARADTNIVLSVQSIAADGTVPPSGSLVTNPQFVRLSDGTTGVPVNTAFALTEAAAQASLLTTSLAMGWNNAGASLSALEVNVDNAVTTGTPNILNVGGVYKATLDTYDDNDATPFHFNVNGALLSQIHDGTTGAAVNTAFAATEAAAQASLLTTGLAMGWNNAGSSLAALEVNVDNAATSGTPNVLHVGGVYKSSLDTYSDNDAAPLHTNATGELLTQTKGYDSGTDSVKNFEVNPLSDQYLNTSLVDTTNIAAAATYYPASTGAVMDGWSDLSFTGKLIEGAAETVTWHIEVSNDEDTAGDWKQVYFYDDASDLVVNQLSVTNGTLIYAVSLNNCNFRRYRVVVTPTSATNTVIVKERKKAL